MNLEEKVSHIVFQGKTKDTLIQETINNLSGLLQDAFTGDDVNQLKKEFPADMKLELIGIQLSAVSVHLNHIEVDVPCVEVKIDMVQEVTQIEIGSYSVYYNEEGEQLDEVLSLM